MIGCPLWIGDPSQMTRTLPRSLREPHAQEADDPLGVEGVFACLQVEAPVQRDATDRREMVMGQCDVPDRRLPPWRPRAHRHRQEVETGFVYPDDGGAFVGRFFWRAGQRSVYHC